MKEKPAGAKKQFNSPQIESPVAESSQAEIELYRLAAIIESSEDAIYSIDFDGTVLSWNKASEKIFGYAAGEIIGQNISILLPDELLSGEFKLLEKIKQGKPVENHKTVRIRKDGSHFPISQTSSPIRNRDGEIIAVSRIARDISERCRDEEKLREYQKLIINQLSEIESVYQTAPVGLAYIDKNLRYVRVNNRLAEMNGLPAEKHIGRTLREILPEDLANNIEPLLRNVLATNKPVLNLELTEAAAHSDLKRNWITNYYPLANPAGEIIGINVVVHDNTQNKKSEEAMWRGKRRLRGLIDNLFSFVALIDLNGTVVDVNRAAVAAASLNFKDVIGKNFTETFWWSWSEVVKNQLGSAIKLAAQGETIRYNALIKIAENQFLTVDLQLAPMFDEDKKISQIVTSAIDISERLRLEAKLVHAKQLSFAGEIAAEIAHEIKNPLTGIQGAIDILLQRQNRNGLEYGILTDVRHEISRIGDLVHSLLNRTRSRPTLLTEASLRETVRRAVQLANHQLAAMRQITNRIIIEQDLPPEPFVLRHDAAQIEDAALNLIINAVEAIGENDGHITVRLYKTGIPANRLEYVIEVSDNGSGISNENAANIFNLFFTTKENGTGLGLFAVKRIAAAHGGYCKVESVYGQGATFTIHLPVIPNF